ncbi:hypothetical protein VTN02DRAFT_1185 [Thermoascus thermophilus]
MKGSLFWQCTPDYNPKYDSLPHPLDRSTIPPEVLAGICHEEFIWEKTSNLSDLKSAWCKSARMAAIPRDNIGLGSHADLQYFTLPWQDDCGGLQVFKQTGKWILASLVKGPFIVNTGVYLMRITNGR